MRTGAPAAPGPGSLGDHEHLGRVAGVEAGTGGLGEHRDRAFGIGALGGGGQDRVAAHHRAAARRDVAGELVDLEPASRSPVAVRASSSSATARGADPACQAAGRRRAAAGRGARRRTRAARHARTRARPSRTRCDRGRGPRPARARPTPARRSRPRPRPGARRGGRRRDRAARPRAPGASSGAPRGRVGVDRRPDERMAELDRAGSQRDEPGALGGRQRGQVDAEPPRCALEQREIAAVAGRQRGAAPAARPRRAHPPGAGTRGRSAPRRAPGRPRARARARRPRGRARAARAGCRRSPRAGGRRRPARARPAVSRLLAAEAADPERRQIGAVEQRRLALANRDQDRDRVGDQPPDGEQQRLGARAVEPVGVVDQHRDRPLLGVGGEQAERRRADREALLGAGRPERERALERDRLRLRDPVEHPERRAQQLEQRRERDLRLGLDPAGAQQLHPARSARGVLEQRGLADPRLADERQRRARRPAARRSSARSIAPRSRSRPSSIARFSAPAPEAERLGGPRMRTRPAASYGRPDNRSEEDCQMSATDRSRRGRRRQADAVRVPGRRRGRRDAERRAGRDGRQARALPGARRQRRAVARGARRAHRHRRALRARVAERAGRRRLRRLRPGQRPLHAAARAGGRAHRRATARPTCRGSSRSRSARCSTRRGSPRRRAAATGSAGTSTSTTSTRAASASSGPATTRTWSPSGCRRSTASSRSSSAARVVADVGCGHGASTILMAQAFPNSTFVGSDYHDGLDRDRARGGREEAGVADRVSFEIAPAAGYSGTGYDLVTMFDCLHDMGDPVGAARHVRATLQARRHLDDRRAERRRPRRGQPQPGRPRLLRRSRRCCARRRRCRRRSGSRSARRPARRGSATSSRRAASPASAARPRRRSTSCSRRGRDDDRRRDRRRPRAGAGRGRRAAGADPRPLSRSRRRTSSATACASSTRSTATGEPTVLLLPTWSIVHSRFWKVQIPYLARHFRVVTFDGRGNGRSDRPAGADGVQRRASSPPTRSRCSTRPAPSAQRWSRCRAARCGRRCSPPSTPSGSTRIVYIGPGRRRSRSGHAERDVARVRRGARHRRRGWAKYNRHYWRATTAASSSSSSPQCFTEPHSTKQIEDCVGWALETTRRDARSTPTRGIGVPRRSVQRRPAARVRCPMLVIHGDEDLIRPHRPGRGARARRPAASSSTLEGAGHLPTGARPGPGQPAAARLRRRPPSAPRGVDARPARGRRARSSSPRRSGSATRGATSRSPTSCAGCTPTSRSTGWRSTR